MCSLNTISYSPADNLTIGDLPLIMGCVCLEAMAFDMSEYPKVQAWYANFKEGQAPLWEVANQGLEELTGFEQNPPDLSHIEHPIHPTVRDTVSESEPPAEEE